MDDPARRLRGTAHGRVVRSGLPGCVAMLLVLPLLALTAVVVAVGALFRGAPRRAPRRRDPVLEGLVAKLALDETFTREEAATAGIPVDETRSVDDLLGEAAERGWIERRGERYAVTERGRAVVAP